MSKDDSVYVGQMFDLAKKVSTFLTDKDRNDFDQDEPLRIAIAHLLQTIGEAARRVSPAYQEAHNEIYWKAIIGMRNKVVHDYMDINDDIVWETAMSSIPDLIAQLQPLVDETER